MQVLIDAIFAIGNYIGRGLHLIRILMDKIWSFWLWQVAFIVGIWRGLVSFNLSILNNVYEKWMAFSSTPILDGNNAPSFATYQDFLELGNYVFPLSELFVYLVLIATLWLVGSTYRFVKSFVPTIS